MDATPTPDHGAADAAAAAHLKELTLGHLYSAALRTAAELRIADRLADGPRTAADLARDAGADASALRRLLRYLASREVFREDDAGAFHLTPAAQPLRTDVPGSLHPAVMMFTDELFLRSSAGLGDTVRTGKPAFPAAFGAPFFEYLATDAAARETFDTGMAAFSGPGDAAVAAAYPFPAHGTVVDVGGGRGGLLREVLLRHPGLTGVLFDQEPALREPLVDTPGTAGRWRTQPGDFLASVPDGGDYYLVKHVLPDWDDDNAVRILASCRRAMAPGGRVLVVDAVPPRGNAPHPGKAVDVMMMAALGGKGRDPQELDALFARAGLRRTRILPTDGFVSVVEAVAS
ncbi:methyltransferase [Streptomyces griseocarneus]|uniref:methyltransferase n=1 Tax=Streptomyces griseocarneus TaxID=51201 RepID=UPI00167DB522|nr:methyltransferase [Streptomyces griseocarneus]MBZ6474361.1 SAM-dependent methyltransferase [Streptomyces griseocarneus]GHG53535.1 methyltransferase [Streptomyces griseocarneus]